MSVVACHATAHRVWTASPHRRAFETLDQLLAELGREWLLHGHLQDRVGMALVLEVADRDVMLQDAIDVRHRVLRGTRPSPGLA